MTAVTTYRNHVSPIMKTSPASDPISSCSCPFKDLSIIRPHFSLLIQYGVWVSIHFPIDFVLWHDVFSLELSTRFHRKAHRILCMEEQIGLKWICWSHISYCSCIEWMCESRWLDWQDLNFQEDITYEEGLREILEKKEQILRTKTIPLVKVLWDHHGVEGATLEMESNMRNKYP